MCCVISEIEVWEYGHLNLCFETPRDATARASVLLKRGPNLFEFLALHVLRQLHRQI